MNDDRALLGGARPPTAPPGLRARTLAAARQAVLGAKREPSRPRHLHLRPFDLAWLAALLILVACHVALSLGGRRPRFVAKSVTGHESSRVADQALAREVGLPNNWCDVSPTTPKTEPPLSLEQVLRDGS
jgi:hypothetical protein